MFWSSNTLARRLESDRLVVPFDEEHIDCAAYQLAVGSEVYVSPDAREEDPTNVTVKRLESGEYFAIPPGQFAFLETDERVTIPKNALAFISIRAKVKFRGLVNVSGFHVDPGFEGPLTFAVFNAGPVSIHIKQGERIFLIWYAELDDVGKHKTRARGQGIDMDVVAGIAGQIPSIAGLAREMAVVGDRVHAIEKQQRAIQTLLALFAGGVVTWLLRGFV